MYQKEDLEPILQIQINKHPTLNWKVCIVFNVIWLNKVERECESPLSVAKPKVAIG